MVSIFEGGLFTIIAGHGNNADASLPGISSPRRDLNVAHLNGISISETPAPFDCDPITDTPWNSRGWTFQENIISRRRLIFLESSIMWSCLTTDRAEEVDLEAKDTEFHFTEEDRYVVSRANLKFPVGSYPGLVAEYSQRDVTNQSDAYDAFGAIVDLTPEDVIWGLQCDKFKQSLSWDASDAPGKLTYRDCPFLPLSWSWVAWKERGIHLPWLLHREK